MQRHERRFWFKLALLLGMSVREAQEKIDAREFAEWMAYFQLEPLPDSWLQHGVLCQLIATALGDKRAKPEHFMPKVKKPPKSSSELKSTAMKLIAQTPKQKTKKVNGRKFYHLCDGHCRLFAVRCGSATCSSGCAQV